MTINEKNSKYWCYRAKTYSDINRKELSTDQKKRWQYCLSNEINSHFKDRKPSDIKVLDIGTGPGFFAIILKELGYDVTAIDMTSAMLDEARRNAGCLSDSIDFRKMNAELLSFEDETIDVIVSRNLTWNLTAPQKAYSEWIRVLKKNGILINFDANWYAHLFDKKALSDYQRDRDITKSKGIEDYNIGDRFDVMDDIARQIPLSKELRPEWDIRVLSQHNVEVSCDCNVWENVWSEQEKINFASTPLFMIKVIKR